MLTLNILGVARRREPLCPTCAYAVTQKGFKGEELTSCGYGGGLRELRFEVRECTAYSNREGGAPRRVAGFIRPEPPEKQNITVIKIA